MRLNTKLLALFTCFIFLVMITGLFAGDDKKVDAQKTETTKTCAQKTDAEKAQCAKTCASKAKAEGDDAKASGCAHGVKSTGASAAAEKDGQVIVQQATGEVKTAAKHDCTAEQKAACAKSKNAAGCCPAKAKTSEASATDVSSENAQKACVSKADPKCTGKSDIEIKVGTDEKQESK